MMTIGVTVSPIVSVPHSLILVLRGSPLRENSINHQTGIMTAATVIGARKYVLLPSEDS